MIRSVFVYGTLKQGEYNSRILSRWNPQQSPAFVLGAALFNGKGGFPAMIPGDQAVEGELVTFAVTAEVFANEILPTLDRLEGVPTLYRREVWEVLHMGAGATETTRAYVYLWNQSLKGWHRVRSTGDFGLSWTSEDK